MPFLDNEQFERITTKRTPEKLTKKPEKKPDPSIFGGEKFFTDSAARKWMRRPRRHMLRADREKLVKKWWGNKKIIGEKHVREALIKIRKETSKAETNRGKFKSIREAELLREMSGKKLS